ncbi:MAG: EAL domain-containing protein [Acholeplasma sp.]|nr:EAL domain-containing protein [Acholeplasma sp.]
MTLKALLDLPKTEESFQEIEAFLAETTDPKEILLAESFYADILLNYQQYGPAIKLLSHIMTSLKNRQDDPNYELALEKLIKAYTNDNQFDKALDAINHRKSTLPVLKRYLYFMDLIELRKAQKLSYDDLIDQALEEVLPDTIKSKFLLEKLDKYVQNKAYDLALLNIDSLKSSKLDPETIMRLTFLELDIYTEKQDARSLERLLMGKTDQTYDYYHLCLLMMLEKYRQASVFEVEHEHRFEQLDTESQFKIYGLLVKLYTKLSDKLSIDTYQKKLKSLRRTSRKIEPVEQKKQDTHIEISSKELKVDIKEKVIEVNKIRQSVVFQQTRELLKMDFHINQLVGLREKVRQLFIEAEKSHPFKEAVLFIEPNTILHYKKQRLYEKTFLKEHFFKSVLHIAHDRQEDIIESRQLLRWPLDIITGKPYDESIQYLYTYHSVFGAITIYQSIEKDIYVEDDFFNLLSVMIFNYIQKEEDNKRVETEKELFKAVYQSDLVAYRIVENELMRFNKKALELFDYPKFTPISQFVQSLKGEDQIRYKNHMNTLKSNSSLIYEYGDKLIEEHATEIRVHDKRIVLSCFRDVTEEKHYQDDLIKTAQVDQKTNIPNKFAFESLSDKYFEAKSTFLLTELKGLEAIQKLYGLSKIEAYFKRFINAHLDFFDKDVYLFDNNKLLIVLPFNDIRATEKKMKQYKEAMDVASDLKQHPFEWASGVIRYPINTTEKKIDKFYAYLSLALEKASRKTSKTFYQYFDFQDYKEEQFELSIIEQMDLAIMEETLEISFSPIVHLNTNKVFSYQVKPYLPNLSVDQNYYSLIAKKRSTIEKFDRYILKKSLKYLQTLEQHTKKYVRLTVEVDEQSIRSKDFNAYLIGLFKVFDLPYTLLEINVKSDHLTDLDFLKLKELYDLGIHIGADDFNYMINSVHFIHLKHKFSLEDIKIYDYLMLQKEYATNHGIGLVFERADQVFIQKMKSFSPIYHIESKKQLSESELTTMIKGVMS